MIWKEFRSHNIIFGCRSVICCISNWIEMNNIYNNNINNIIKSCITILIFYYADIITKSKKVEKESTTRTLPYWDGCSKKLQQNIKKFYSFAQFQATLACVMSNNINAAFTVMFPIQIASLLMTCVRKGLLTSKQYHILYFISLLIPTILHINYNKFYVLNIISFITWYSRINFKINKYYIWFYTFILFILYYY